MDSFFGIGFPELVFILIIAGLVMGPHRIRHVARTLGRFVAQMQVVSRQFTRQLNAELDALDSPELKGAVEDMKDLRREVEDLRRQMRSMPQELASEGRSTLRQAVNEGQQALEESRQALGERDYKPVSRPRTEAQTGSGRADNGGAGNHDGAGHHGGAAIHGGAANSPAPVTLPTPIEVADDPEK